MRQTWAPLPRWHNRRNIRFPTRPNSALYWGMNTSRKPATARSGPTLWPARRRLPAFAPVPVRARRDGLDARRQGQFIGYLAETGCVTTAAARVGRSRESAYRLRRRADAGDFAAAWDAALTARSGMIIPARKVTPDSLYIRAFHGPIQVHMYRGRFVSVSQTPCNTALLRLLSQYDRALRAHDRGDGPRGVTRAFTPRFVSTRSGPFRWRAPAAIPARREPARTRRNRADQ